MVDVESRIAGLAELAVHCGANVQPGQIVSVASEPGKEVLARAIADAAYAAGAKFVDLSVFDVFFKRARALHADRDSLAFVPPWIGERLLALSEYRAARISLSGPVAPHALDGVDPEIIGLDILPRVPESMRVTNAGTTNWTVVPCPTADWASLLYPQLEAAVALERLWEQVARVCRLDEPDPIAAWRSRRAQLMEVARRLNALNLDGVHFEGPGTDLTIGLLPSSQWLTAASETTEGIEHQVNLPSEEIFTTPDPLRVEGVVSATKPLFTSGTTVTGLQVEFKGGRAVAVNADQGAEVVRGMVATDAGASRLGEVALVDQDSRVGLLDTVFYDTLLDENAASHLALGGGYQRGVRDAADIPNINHSAIHTDFMIGSDTISVTGLVRDGTSVDVLRSGQWQI